MQAHFNLGIVHQELGALGDALRCTHRRPRSRPWTRARVFNLSIRFLFFGNISTYKPGYDTAARLDDNLADAANAAEFIRKNFADVATEADEEKKVEDC